MSKPKKSAAPAAVEPAQGKSQELILVETAITRISAVDKGIAELRAKFDGVIFDVATNEGMEAAKAARKEVATPRIMVEKIRVEAKAPLLQIQRQLDGEAKRIKEALEAIERPIDDQITAEERRLEAIEQAKKDAEAARVGAILNRITEIRGAPTVAAKLTASDAIERHLVDLLAIDALDPAFEEYGDEALVALNDSIESLTAMLDAARDREEQQRDIAARAAALAQQQAEQNERDRQRAENEATERRRREGIEDRIRELRGPQNLTASSGADAIALKLMELEALHTTADLFEEFVPQAIDAKAAGVARLKDLMAAAVAHEAEQKRQAETRQRLDAEERDRQKAAAIQTKMNFFNEALVRGLRLNTSQDLQRLIAEVESRVVDESFEGFQKQAQDLKDSAIAMIRESCKAFFAREEEARQRAEREAEATRAREAEETRQREEAAERERAAEAERLANFRPTLDDLSLAVAQHYLRDKKTARAWIVNAVADAADDAEGSTNDLIVHPTTPPNLPDPVPPPPRGES